MLTRIAKDKSCKIQAKIFFKRTSYKTQFLKGALELKMHYDNYFIEWKRLQPGNGYYLTSGGGGDWRIFVDPSPPTRSCGNLMIPLIGSEWNKRNTHFSIVPSLYSVNEDWSPFPFVPLKTINHMTPPIILMYPLIPPPPKKAMNNDRHLSFSVCRLSRLLMTAAVALARSVEIYWKTKPFTSILHHFKISHICRLCAEHLPLIAAVTDRSI